MTVGFRRAVSTRQQNQRALTRRAYVKNCLYLLEGTSHCATHYGKNLALFRVNQKENLKMNQTLPRTWAYFLTLGNNLITKQIKKTTEVDSRVVKCAGACKHCVSHVVTRFCTDIRFTCLLSPICTLLISTYSLYRFHKFPANGLLVSLRSSRHGYAPRSEMNQKRLC